MEQYTEQKAVQSRGDVSIVSAVHRESGEAVVLKVRGGVWGTPKRQQLSGVIDNQGRMFFVALPCR